MSSNSNDSFSHYKNDVKGEVVDQRPARCVYLTNKKKTNANPLTRIIFISWLRFKVNAFNGVNNVNVATSFKKFK